MQSGVYTRSNLRGRQLVCASVNWVADAGSDINNFQINTYTMYFISNQFNNLNVFRKIIYCFVRC